MSRRPDNWQALLKAAERAEGPVMRGLLEAIFASDARINMRQLARALERRNEAEAVRVVLKAWERGGEEVKRQVVSQYMRLQGYGAQIGAEAISQSFRASLNLTNPRSIAWAETQSSALIRTLSQDTERAVRSLIAQSFREGIPTRTIARDIRGIIGLDQRSASAVTNYRGFLESIQRGTESGRITSRADLSRTALERMRRSDIRLFNARDFDNARIDRLVTRYEERLLNRNALTIARTETITAANQGQQEAWREAVQQGLIDPAVTRRRWITTPDDRLCPICMGLDGQLRGLEEAFVSKYDGSRAFAPPVHPNCRCTFGLVFIDKENPEDIVPQAA